MKEKLEEAKRLYEVQSKHSQYQRLASILREVICLEDCTEGKKYEDERMRYITSHISLGKKIADIGGNSGYFTFESISNGVEHVDYWEGNSELARFVELSSELVGINDKINVYNEYFNFNLREGDYDTILLLNVIHHLGSDFEIGIGIQKAKEIMLKYINALAYCGKQLVFQMGFNWGGDLHSPLFNKGLKKEMIDYIANGTKSIWDIRFIGIPMKRNDVFDYEDVSSENLERHDEFGEFLNRPLFIMTSLVHKG